MILIFSQQEDSPTTELVTDQLKQSGSDYLIVDTTRLNKIRFAVEETKGSIQLQIETNRVPIQDITSVWVRRPFRAVPDSDAAGNHMQTEFRTLTEGLIAVLKAHNVFILNDPQGGLVAANKLVQWDAFRTLGIPTPATSFSNNVEGIKPATKITKQLAHKLLSIQDEEYIFPTKVLGASELKRLKEFSLPPMILQDFLDVAYEVRVTVVGKNIFAARIDYDATKTNDYRKLFGVAGGLTYSVYDLPEDTQKHCLRILEHFNLSFGCIDVAVDKSGKHWILELNPNGQWGWIEKETKLPIAAALAELLVDPKAFLRQ